MWGYNQSSAVNIFTISKLILRDQNVHNPKIFKPKLWGETEILEQRSGALQRGMHSTTGENTPIGLIKSNCSVSLQINSNQEPYSI